MSENNLANPWDSFTFPRTGHVVRNRAVLAAMTNKQSHEDGSISDQEIRWLNRRAKGEFGIVTTAAANVSEDGQGWEGEIGLYNDRQIENLRKLVNSVHDNGGLLFGQLFHGGMRAPESLTGNIPISASKIACEDSSSGFTRSASLDDINRIIEDFTLAAERCVKSGIDGVELHGAHGYLITQFLGNKTNTRKDEWGGDIIGRSKFLIEIYRSIKKSVPESFIIGVRISPEINEIGITLDDSIKLAKILRDERIDFLHLSCWDIYKTSKQYPKDPKTLTEWFTKNITDLPTVISSGKIWSSKDAQNVFKQGADFAGVARVGIPYPDWPKNLRNSGYSPLPGPFTVKQLKEADLGDVFIDYMRNWKGFVEDGR